MKPETRAFLASVHGADTPSVEDEERVLRALRASVVLGASASVAVSSSATGWWSSSLGGCLKFMSIAGCAVALVATDTPNVVLEVARRDGVAVSSTALLSTVPSLAVLSTAASPTAVSPEPSTAAAHNADNARAAPSSRAAIRAPVRALVREPSVPSAASLSAELKLLHVVQSALKQGDGASALRALDAHKTLDRQFLPERAAARILALCAEGRIVEARQAAARFADAHPSSVHHAAIARSCANSKRIDSP
jgi:hypothetical protein